MTTATQRPLPDLTPRMRPFWAAVADGRLTVQHCRDCGRKHFPAIDICNGCLGDSLEWIDVSGRASVFSYVIMHQVYHPAFADRAPYVVADVKLEEGPRIISNVIGCAPDAVTIGMPLVVEFERVSSAAGPQAGGGADAAIVALPVFRPAP